MFVFVLQAFQQTIGIFQQKNESFKNALKDVEQVSVSVTSKLYTHTVKLSLFCTVIRSMFFLFWYRMQSWGNAPLAGSATMKWRCAWSAESLSMLWHGGDTTAEPAALWVTLMHNADTVGGWKSIHKGSLVQQGTLHIQRFKRVRMLILNIKKLWCQ